MCIGGFQAIAAMAHGLFIGVEADVIVRRHFSVPNIVRGTPRCLARHTRALCGEEDGEQQPPLDARGLQSLFYFEI